MKKPLPFVIQWDYSDVRKTRRPRDPNHFDIHFSFSLRFPRKMPGSRLVEHFCFNVASADMARKRDVSATKRGTIVVDSFNYSQVIRGVQKAIREAFQGRTRKQAIEILNKQFVYTDADFSGEFRRDVLPPKKIIAMIHDAFDGVERGDGTTLHQAHAMDNYESAEDQLKARELDKEKCWQDVPADDIENNQPFLTYLDPRGLRYYLPAAMTLALKNGRAYGSVCAIPTWQRLLPVVAPRDRGQGFGERFDVRRFIAMDGFTPKQVKAIYLFLCYMAVKGPRQVGEDEYPAMLKWKRAALGGPQYLRGIESGSRGGK